MQVLHIFVLGFAGTAHDENWIGKASVQFDLMKSGGKMRIRSPVEGK